MERKLDKSTLIKNFLIGINFFNNCHSYQRNFGIGFAASMSPVLKKLYPDNPQEIKDGLSFYADKYYITEPSTGMVINAIVSKMEEARANGAAIEREDMEAVKSGLMGALAGFGDTIFTSTLRPIGMALFTPMAISGNVLGPLGFWIGGACCRWANGIFWYQNGLKYGTDALNVLIEGGNEKLREAMELVGVMAMFIMGAMAANYVNPKFALSLTVGENVTELDKVVNGLIPGFLPLLTVFGTYYLISKKKISATTIILGLTVICLLGALVGLF